MAAGAHQGFARFEQFGQATIGKPFLLELTQLQRTERRQLGFFQLQFDLDDLFNLDQEPTIDFGEVKDLIHRQALGKGVSHVPNALGTGLTQFFFQDFTVLGLFVHAVDTDFQAPQSFLERFLEGAPHGHHLAHRLHLRRQAAVGGREFLESKAWDLGHHVIDAGLKTGGGGPTRDVVAQFVQGVAHGQFGRHFGDGKPRGLGGQGRRA